MVFDLKCFKFGSIQLLLLAALVCERAQSNLLCEQLLKGLRPALADSRLTGAEKDHAVVNGIILRLIGQRPYDPHSRNYARFFLSTIPRGRTAHSPSVDDRLGYGGSDQTVVLSLPRSESPSVWGTLSPNQKSLLAQKLAEVFRRGVYEPAIDRDEGKIDRQIYRVYDRRFQSNLLEHQRAGIVGFSPLKLLRGAYWGCRVGVCRSTNAALAGLLGELGIPNSDIRLVSGYVDEKDKQGHTWVEYRVGPDQPWIQADATPNSGAPIGSPDLRRIFPYEIEEYIDFLTPLPE